jgi:predicted acyl esterase
MKAVVKKNSLRQVAGKISNLIKPKNYLVKEASANMRILRDFHIPMRDGKYLSANIYMPNTGGKFSPLVALHPARKDVVCRNGYMHIQYRFARQPGKLAFSDETSFEAPDPDFWVANGFAVINIDKRGFGLTPGDDTPQGFFDDREIQDLYDAVEWAGVQDWSNGNVGMLGVSYLAINQYKVAAMNPPHLKAMCPWEGVSDLYKDWFYPGGVREYGFTPFLFKRLQQFGFGEDLGVISARHPLRDDFWKSYAADFSRITVPMLNCVSFSCQMFHSRGSQRVYEQSGSSQKWLYTHRNGEWTEYYSTEATAMMLKFFTQFLKEQNTGMMNHPRVRLEVRESGDQIKEVRYEEQWPPAGIVWKSLGLSNSSRFLYPVSNESPDADIPASFRLKNAAVEYTYRFTQDTEITGPARLSLFVSLAGIDDANLYAGIRKFRNGKEVGFEGTYGFPRDLVSKAALRVALRRINTELSRPESPEHDFDTMEPVAPGEIVKLDFQFSPSSTFYRAGDELRLVIQGRYFIDGKKIHQPFRYAGNNRGVCRIHSGPETNSELLLPFINRG